MGEVYLAQDTKLDRKVALKILPAEVASNQDRMTRFVREAKAAAALNHPNIAHIYEIDEVDGQHFIAMEFIDGETLRQCIRASHADLIKLLRYLQHAAEGLAKAHKAGIVHRDLKPDNIMITRDGQAKVPDERYQTIKDVAIELKELRRELQASGADTTAPALTGSLVTEASEPPSLSLTTSTPPASLSSRASSAEYVVTGIKQHKLALIVSAIILGLGIVAASAYLLGRNSNAAIGSIAVLPFVNAGGDANTDYLSDGITESLINSCSQFSEIRVVPRSTVFRYK